MKLAAVLVFIATLGFTDIPQVEERPKTELAPQINSYSGLYNCVGNDGDAEYQYTVKMIRAGKTYVVHWIAENGQIFSGIGILKGDKLSIALNTKGATTLYLMEKKGNGFEGEYCSMHHDGTKIVRVQADRSGEKWTLIKRFE